MHMSDALVSPAVGGVMWCASATLVGVASAKLRRAGENEGFTVPMMGIMGAFVFAAQMLNFSIPGTGSSGHLGGGILLAALLGPWAALLTIASILVVQAVFFADGGFLALGCNVFNMGVLPCLIAYPLVAVPLMGRANSASPGRLAAALAVASVVALQLGAFAVVCETWLSGISALPFRQFVLLMQPIHLAIGLVEGLATASVVLAVRRQGLPACGVLLPAPGEGEFPLRRTTVRHMGILAGAALLMGGAICWFASSQPDGLEWAVARTAPENALNGQESSMVHRELAAVQSRTALLPDYDFPPLAEERAGNPAPSGQEPAESETWPNVQGGASLAGIVGGAVVAFLLVAMGWMLRKGRAGAASASTE